MLGTGIYIPLSHVVLVPSPFQVEISIAELKKCNHQLLFKFWQNWFKQEAKHYILKSINSSNMFEIRKNFLSNQRSLLLYQFISRAVILTSNY
jgi:hypothetical protein